MAVEQVMKKHDKQLRPSRLAFHWRLDRSYFLHSRSTGILIAAEATGDNQITDNIEAQFFLAHHFLRAADIVK
jgi:hypothetical protein